MLVRRAVGLVEEGARLVGEVGQQCGELGRLHVVSQQRKQHKVTVSCVPDYTLNLHKKFKNEFYLVLDTCQMIGYVFRSPGEMSLA